MDKLSTDFSTQTVSSGGATVEITELTESSYVRRNK